MMRNGRFIACGVFIVPCMKARLWRIDAVAKFVFAEFIHELQFLFENKTLVALEPFNTLESATYICHKNSHSICAPEMCDGKGGEPRWETKSFRCQQLLCLR